MDPYTLNLDPDPEFGPNLDPNPAVGPNLDPDPQVGPNLEPDLDTGPDPYPDPGLFLSILKKIIKKILTFKKAFFLTISK